MHSTALVIVSVVGNDNALLLLHQLLSLALAQFFAQHVIEHFLALQLSCLPRHISRSAGTTSALDVFTGTQRMCLRHKQDNTGKPSSEPNHTRHVSSYFSQCNTMHSTIQTSELSALPSGLCSNLHQWWPHVPQPSPGPWLVGGRSSHSIRCRLSSEGGHARRAQAHCW